MKKTVVHVCECVCWKIMVPNQPIQPQQGGCDLVKRGLNFMHFLPESEDFDTVNKLGVYFFPPLSVYVQ